MPLPSFLNRPRRLLAGSAAVAAMLCSAAGAAAEDLFGVTVSNGTNTITVTSSNLFDLAEKVIESQDEFSVFEGTDFTGSLDYANLEGAIVVTGNTADTVRIQIPSIGFDRTFSDEDEAEEFLRNEGASTVAAFIQVVNEQTLIGVTDGNPTALTALMTDESFRLFAQPRNPFAGYAQGNDAGRLFVQGGFIETDIGDGTIIDGAFSTGFKFTDHVGLTLSTPGSYRVIEDSATFTIGGILGVPIKFTPETNDNQPVLWQITPFGHVAGGGSEDQLSGGLVVGGGVTNLIGFKIGDFFLHSGQELAFYHGQPIEVSDFRFETDVDQTIFKGDVGLTYGGFGDNSAYLQAGVKYTQFLEDAAIDNYVSPYVAVAFKLGGASSFRIGYRGDIADGFDTHRAELELRLAH